MKCEIIAIPPPPPPTDNYVLTLTHEELRRLCVLSFHKEASSRFWNGLPWEVRVRFDASLNPNGIIASGV